LSVPACSASDPDREALARELLTAWTERQAVAVPPSERDIQFDLDAAYAVEAEIARLRAESGRKLTGRKVGYANKAMWRILKLETLVWAHMYDDTVRDSRGSAADLDASQFRAARIEPEIVFRLKEPAAEGADAAAALACVDWIALGFEIIDCPFPDWKFQPPDFVAALGLHAALVVGEPRRVDPRAIPDIVEQLGAFKLRLSKNGELVEEGAGKNSLRSPALCLAELASAAGQRGEPLARGELVSTGTLTTAQAVERGDHWRADTEGLEIGGLELAIR